MSPRQMYTRIMQRSVITTRARAQKLNSTNEVITKSIRKTQSQKRNKSSVQKNFETNKSDKEQSPNAKISLNKSGKKKISRMLKFVKETKAKDEVTENENVGNQHFDCVSPRKFVKRKHSISRNLKASKKLQQELLVPNILLNVTPKSTPIKLSLTPHRSTKTPKKSPISLSSPKTHSRSVSKLLKVPRKLSLTPGENPDKFDNDFQNKKLQKTGKDSLSNTLVSDKTLSVGKNKRNKSNERLKIVRKFSKSPKIVLRPPKSKKSKLSRLKLSLSRISKSPLKRSLANSTSDNDTPTFTITQSMKQSKKKTTLLKNVPIIKGQLLSSKLMKILTASQIKDMQAEPIVLLERLPVENRQTMFTVISKNHSDTLINVGNSFKILTSKETSAGSDVFLHLRGGYRESEAKLMKRSSKLSPISTKHNMSVQRKNSSSISLISSTPHKEQMLLNLTTSTPVVSVDDISLSKRLRFKNESVTQVMLSNTNNSISIENTSKPSLLDKDIDDINQTQLSNAKKQDITYDINEDITMFKKKQSNKKNTTYELKEPQTPSLRQMVTKRTAIDANLSDRDVKKSCKVHFAGLIPDTSNVRKLNSKPIESRINVQRKYGTRRSNSTHISKKAGIPKFHRASLLSPLKTKLTPMIDEIRSKTQLKRKSRSLDAITPNLFIDKLPKTPKNVISAEKKTEKKSSVKKVPNFGRIHEKMFAKSESLVDKKKRLEKRHLTLTTNKVLSKVNPKEEVKLLPTDTNNGTHNRFGFRLRQAEATHIMLKKQTVFSRQKQRHETRMILKGVRTNRRYELQMKARNINI